MLSDWRYQSSRLVTGLTLEIYVRAGQAEIWGEVERTGAMEKDGEMEREGERGQCGLFHYGES